MTQKIPSINYVIGNIKKKEEIFEKEQESLEYARKPGNVDSHCDVRKACELQIYLYRGVKLAAHGPNVARDIIFCGLRKDFEAQCECLASEFGLRKIVLQKKPLKLKLRENSDYRVMRLIYKKVQVAIE